MDSYDLVISGAGFAGLACADAAARRGLRTLVLEKKPDPGARPHTTGILVKEVADGWDAPRQFTRKVRGVRLYAPSLKSVDLVSPGYYFLATDTPGLLRWWAQHAEASGAEVRCDAPFRGVEKHGDLLRFKERDVEGRYLIGADGAKSKVAEMFNLGRNTQHLVGVEAEYTNVRGVDPDRLHVFLDSELAPGYIAWVVPGVDIYQVGLAVRKGREVKLEPFMEQVRKVFDFSAAECVSKRGGLIPVGGLVKPIGRDNVMLVGDAAGMVSPLTAGGIHTALDYGRLAGLAVCDHLLDNGPDPIRVMSRQLPRFGVKRLMRASIDMRPPNGLYNLMLGSRVLRSLAQVVFFHKGMFSPAAWHDAWQHVILNRSARLQHAAVTGDDSDSPTV
ncbi:MAG: FAD-dependent oxidoreductase [Phycisphaera sp.]|nr:FAD-dependent oxidoreductase [Phycisphaera sp.]